MILIKPILSEKALKIMEVENKLLFEVNRNATRPEIKQEFEKTFNAKVAKVNTLINSEGKKIAFIKLKEGKAIDIAAKLGLI
ncbi:MAG: 50S ribosomal protein L23 [Candidatus Pacearchaeota archaeon]